MGHRMDSFIGLNLWARQFVKGNQLLAYTEVTVRCYPSGTQEQMPPKEVYISDVECSLSGQNYMGYEEHPLHKYKFPNGERYSERVQKVHYSSGPVIFTALYNEATHEWVVESRWKDNEMKMYV